MSEKTPDAFQERFERMIKDPKMAKSISMTLKFNLLQRVSSVMNHEPSDPNSLLGALDIDQVWRDYGKKWPAPSINMLAQLPSKSSDGPDFYKETYKRLEQEYVKSLIADGTMLSYEQFQALPKITLHKDEYPKNNPFAFPTMAYNETLLPDIRKHGWKQFIPPFKECAIQVNRRSFYHLKLLEVKKNGLVAYIGYYTGSRSSFTKSLGATFELTFTEELNGYTSMKINLIESESNEWIVCKNIDSMKWTDAEKEQYCDLLQVRRPEEFTYVIVKECDIAGLDPDMLDRQCHDVVCSGSLGNLDDISGLHAYFPDVQMTVGYDNVKKILDPIIIKKAVTSFVKTTGLLHMNLRDYVDAGNTFKLDSDGFIKVDTEMFSLETKTAPNIRTLNKEVI